MVLWFDLFAHAVIRIYVTVAAVSAVIKYANNWGVVGRIVIHLFCIDWPNPHPKKTDMARGSTAG
tara:strand:+ start:618 stop:812 length:195 start_codon:yes stop_codon:yes gene_type:complete